MHTELPTVANVPAAHAVHTEALVVLAKRPATHDVHTDTPALLNVPTGHCVHTAALAPLEVPAGQRVALRLPDGQNEPAGHAAQVDWPSFTWKVPAGQSEHDDALVGENVPGAHARHADAPPVLK